MIWEICFVVGLFAWFFLAVVGDLWRSHGDY